MRFSLRNRNIDFEYDVEVDEIDIRPSEGSLYVHWEPPECQNNDCTDQSHCRWEAEVIMWTCVEHTPESVDIEVYAHCSNCGKPIDDEFVFGGGNRVYCSEQCQAEKQGWIYDS